jgi:hypothetical protein
MYSINSIMISTKLVIIKACSRTSVIILSIPQLKTLWASGAAETVCSGRYLPCQYP